MTPMCPVKLWFHLVGETIQCAECALSQGLINEPDFNWWVSFVLKKRARDNDENVIGRSNEKPILDTRGYIVEFEDGEQAELAANTIAQSMYYQCDPDGNQYVMFDSIVDFRRSTTALCYSDQKVLKADGRSFMRRTTAGWHLCVQWKDGSTLWEKLSDLKDSHPDECA